MQNGQLTSPHVAGSPDVLVVLDDGTAGQGLLELRGRLGEVLSAADSRLVVDVSGLDKLSSAVVAALLWSKRTCLARGVAMSVRGAAGNNLSLLRRAGLSQTLEVRQQGRR
jgi:anti-anti-sigma regulatory factor